MGELVDAKSVLDESSHQLLAGNAGIHAYGSYVVLPIFLSLPSVSTNHPKNQTLSLSPKPEALSTLISPFIASTVFPMSSL